MFGERPEIRVCKGHTDRHASDRYFELSRALKEVNKGSPDVNREKMDVTPNEIRRMRILSSTLTWDKPRKTISYSWCIQNVGKMRFPTGCQVWHVVQAVDNNSSIDCSYAKVTVPQGHYSDEKGIVSEDSFNLVPSSIILSEVQDCCHLKVEHRIVDVSHWVRDIWVLVAGQSKEFGERLDLGQSFQQTEIDSKADIVRTLVSETRWTRVSY